jgi:hypothetical protein
MTRFYGDGVAGWAATLVAARAVGALRSATRREPELLDVSSLRPGESYVVTTRPAPDRKERRLIEASAKAQSRLDRAEHPSRKLRKAERELRVAERRLARTRAGSRRERKATAVLLESARRVDALRVPSRKVRKRRAELASADGALSVRREKALAQAQKRVRPARRRQFH